MTLLDTHIGFEAKLKFRRHSLKVFADMEIILDCSTLVLILNLECNQ